MKFSCYPFWTRGAITHWTVVLKVRGSNPARARILLAGKPSVHPAVNGYLIQLRLGQGRFIKAVEGEEWAPPSICRALARWILNSSPPLPPLGYGSFNLFLTFLKLLGDLDWSLLAYGILHFIPVDLLSLKTRSRVLHPWKKHFQV